MVARSGSESGAATPAMDISGRRDEEHARSRTITIQQGGELRRVFERIAVQVNVAMRRRRPWHRPPRNATQRRAPVDDLVVQQPALHGVACATEYPSVKQALRRLQSAADVEQVRDGSDVEPFAERTAADRRRSAGLHSHVPR